ncbi:MAG: serine protease [Planctomycetia bacterium]|nr:serine protease [Planctomycetia bacterium]
MIKFLLKSVCGIVFGFLLTTVVNADLYNASKACIRVSTSDGVGSGVVVGADSEHYYALTNAHVATGKTVTVEFFDASQIVKFQATVVLRSQKLDIAILKIKTEGKYNPSLLPLDPNYTIKKDDVLATMGHPQGRYPTTYFCSYIDRSDAFGYRFTPPPKQGRSGSPLLASDGSRVVGIVYGYTTSDNAGLAIPADVIARYVEGATTGKKVTETWFPKTEGVERLGMESVLSEGVTNVPEKLESAGDEVNPTARRFRQRGRRWERFFQRKRFSPEEQQEPFQEHDLTGTPIVKTQYMYSFPVTDCPSGHCPSTSSSSGDIIGEKPPIEIIGGKDDILPDPPNVEPKTVKKKAVEEPEEKIVPVIPSAFSGRVAKLEKRVEDLEATVNALKKEHAEETKRKTIPDALENGISSGIIGATDKITVSVSEDLQTVAGSSALALSTTAEACTLASESFSATMKKTSETLTVVDSTLNDVRDFFYHFERLIIASIIAFSIIYIVGRLLESAKINLKTMKQEEN